MSAKSFFDGYAGMEIELESGQIVKAKALPLATAVKYVRLWKQAAAGTAEEKEAIRYQIVADFPAEAGIAAETLTLEEFWDVFDCFFGRRLKRGAPEAQDQPPQPPQPPAPLSPAPSPTPPPAGMTS